MERRRIALLDAAGCIFREIDISDIDNADAQAPITIQIVTVPWGSALEKPSWPARA